MEGWRPHVPWDPTMKGKEASWEEHGSGQESPTEKTKGRCVLLRVGRCPEGRVLSAQAGSPEPDPQHPHRSQAQWHTLCPFTAEEDAWDGWLTSVTKE